MCKHLTALVIPMFIQKFTTMQNASKHRTLKHICHAELPDPLLYVVDLLSLLFGASTVSYRHLKNDCNPLNLSDLIPSSILAQARHNFAIAEGVNEACLLWLVAILILPAPST